MNIYWRFIISILLTCTVSARVVITPVQGASLYSASPASCGKNPLALQVLGSGGPIADDGRASTGYLLWIKGKSRLMVDAGGGTFLRFGEAGAQIEDLNLFAMSHFHTDHVADLAAIPEHAGKIAKQLHATPSVVGQIAQEVEPDILVLNHFMRRSLNNLSVNLSVVKERYSGKLILAEDLQCIPL